jgi:sugar phosphate isomerase/epimerase
MLALSTSWKSTSVTDAHDLLDAMERLPISGLELEYRISEAGFRQMQKPLKNSRLNVVSVHNFFPKPDVRPGRRAGGDYFLLSSPEREERDRAVSWTCKTIEHAARLGVQAVVLHCGRVEMNRDLDTIYGFFESKQIHSIAAQKFIRKKLKERDAIKEKFLESLVSSLASLCREAEKHGIMLGLENRYHYDELPTLDDFERIFARLDGAPLGYWHDTGHAHVNERLTLIPPESLLSRYADRLIGIHLHDAVDLEDHLAPGCGEIIFENLKPHLKADTLKVIELKSGVKESDVVQGIHYIRKLLC